MCKGKIHRATVTEANLNYVGSVTVDDTLLKASGMREYEQVHIVNNNNGARLITYIIKGKANSGVICLNGAASRLAQPGDIVILLAYADYNEEELKNFHPKIVHVNQENSIISEIEAIQSPYSAHASDSAKKVAIHA